jgi:hypothetical protein
MTKDSFGEYVSGTTDSDLVKDIFNFGLATAVSLEIVYGEFETIALLEDGAFEGLGLEKIPVGPIDAIMNVINSASLTFEAINGFLNWLVNQSSMIAMSTANSATIDQVTKYSVSYFPSLYQVARSNRMQKWGLTVVNFAASTVVRIVGKARKAEQYVIKVVV